MNLPDADRHAHRDAEAGDPDGPERVHHAAAVHDRDVDQQRSAREGRSAEDLRRRVERELALEHTGGRPGDGGERHVDLPAPLAPRRLERHRRRGHAGK